MNEMGTFLKLMTLQPEKNLNPEVESSFCVCDCLPEELTHPLIRNIRQLPPFSLFTCSPLDRRLLSPVTRKPKFKLELPHLPLLRVHQASSQRTPSRFCAKALS
ncbi:hypothetical protein Bpfe_019370 [Biomphalaria pfeifferi]|uniref:Uncharacterized protein n=1 Tax=Biomphalaria pfeifferi TaxID=112525 RepID=A0AAD8BAV9_BIOPF|nr:hypothetical protein Bpfe_019370 [Biomphalaria pfeifferi]